VTWTPGQPLTIASEHFVLRSLTAADVDDRMVGWFADREVMEYVALPMDVPRDELLRFVQGFDNKHTFLLGLQTGEGRLIGFYRVWCYFQYGYAKTAVLVGDRDYWGKKTVLETRAVLLDFLFDGLGLHKATGAVYTRNHAAVFNYKAQGFRCEGILREQEPGRDGRWLDVYLFGLLRDEWKARKRQGGPMGRPSQ